jgi:hypothetical protein
MNRARRKLIVLLASILLALVGAWAASRSSVRRDSVSEVRSAKISASHRANTAVIRRDGKFSSGISIDQSVIAGGGRTTSGLLSAVTINAGKERAACWFSDSTTAASTSQSSDSNKPLDEVCCAECRRHEMFIDQRAPI